jgi:predicted nucleotidyltransferase/HEPN domain-containing protein
VSREGGLRRIETGPHAAGGERALKTSLDHLPPRKQQQLRAIVDVLRAGAPLEMLLLFGSHARGDWVEDPEGGYYSDYDLLAIVEDRKVAEDAMLWARLEAKARELSGESLVGVIAHDIKFVNGEIRVGSYFFGDIRHEGVVLYDSQRFTLASPKEASPLERAQRAEKNFAYWFESANDFLEAHAFSASRGRNANAAFQLHQAAERLYTTASIVFTGYKRKAHDLTKLHAEAAPLHPDLGDVLPRATPEDEHLFDLLRRAYIDARYDKSYRITAEELSALGQRVRTFAAVVERVCREKIASLRAAAEVAEDG